MTLTELKNTVRFYLGNIDTTSYSDANIVAALNRYYHKAIAKAIQVNGQWEVNGEVATTNIVSGQQEYVLTTPVPLLALKRIELNLTGETNNWYVPEVVDMRNVSQALSNDVQLNGTKTSYIRIYDNSLFLMDIPTQNVTAGLKIYYQYEAVDLSSETDSPNLIEEIQTYLVNGACYDYCVGFDLSDKAQKFYVAMQNDLNELEKVYTSRLPASRPRITTTNELYQ